MTFLETIRRGARRRKSARSRPERRTPGFGQEMLEPRLLLAREEGFQIVRLKDDVTNYPCQVLAIAPSSATFQPVNVTFSINGGPTFARSQAQLMQNADAWAGEFWAVKLVDDQGTPIVPFNATWQIHVTATWSDNQPTGDGTIYYQSTDTQFVSPIALYGLDYPVDPDRASPAPSLPAGVGAIRASTYEQIAAITIDRSKTTTVTLPLETLVGAGQPATHTYSVVRSTEPNDATTWKVITAAMSADEHALVLTVDAKNDTNAAGMAAIQITDTTDPAVAPRYLGVQVTDSAGRLPVKPQHVAIGAVNQNGVNDTAFFRGTVAGDPIGFKQMDYQYIYLNGGPKKRADGSINESSWRYVNGSSDYDGKKLIQALRESWKGGSIPTVVYYNISGSDDESAALALSNLKNQDFIRHYFEDLKFTIETIRRGANGAAAALIIEPDMLAYMMQSTYASGSQADPDSIKLGYDVVQVAKTAGLISDQSALVGGLGSTLVDFVKVINEGARHLSTGGSETVTLQLGWLFNLWANQAAYTPTYGPDGKSKGAWQHGIATVSDFYLDSANMSAGESVSQAFAASQVFITQIAKDTAAWYYKAGVTSAGMDFMAMDKYGTDGGNDTSPGTRPGYTNPQAAPWLFNSDHWSNYLLYAKTISRELATLEAVAGVSQVPIRLWQIPVGHVNNSQVNSTFTKNPFAPIPNTAAGPSYEDSAVTWVFGDTFKPTATSTTGTPAGTYGQTPYWARNAAGDAGLTSQSGAVKWAGHIEALRDGGVEAILFGPGTGESTVAGGYANKAPADDFFWISAVQKYLRSPVPLAAATSGATSLTASVSAVARTLGSTPTVAVEVTRPATAPAGRAARASVGLPTASLPVRVIGGTADAGSDYTKAAFRNLVARFEPGQTKTHVWLPLLPTRTAQPRETLVLRIGSDRNGEQPAVVRVDLGATPNAAPEVPIALTSVAGRRLLASSASSRAALQLLSQPTETTGTGGAGLATAALVLNALGVERPSRGAPFDAVLLAEHPGVRTALAGYPLSEGLTLAGVTTVLRSLSIRAETTHAVVGELAAFRRRALATLAARDGFTVVNYDRSILGLGTGSHFAALGAYNARTDRFLLVEADRSTQPPVWVPVKRLFEAMQKIDPRVGIPGGYAIIRR